MANLFTKKNLTNELNKDVEQNVINDIEKNIATNFKKNQKQRIEVSKDLQDNINFLGSAFKDCGDIVKREFNFGKNLDIKSYIIYFDLLVDRDLIDRSIIYSLADEMAESKPEINSNTENLFEIIKNTFIGTVDLRVSDDLTEIKSAVLSGDTALFIDKSTQVIIIATKGWPNRGIPSVENEVSIHGSKESFSDVFRFNTVLIRRRVRDERLKCKQYKVGTRSETDVAVMYMQDIAKDDIVLEIINKIEKINIDAIYDAGHLDQIIEENWLSPFPQSQLTERPDKASSALLEGRVVIVVDNSPLVLVLPTTLNIFFQASDDYFQRTEIVSFVRIIRYVAGVLSVCSLGLYLCVSVYHPYMIPIDLVYKISDARKDVPFPPLLELLAMDLSFELLREAGIRLPSPIGSTIGIVGGLIIGQSAVEAGLVSPIIVIIVAFSAITSFTVPNVDLVSGFRISKYIITIASAFLGFLGFWLSILLIATHLSALKSFGVPYLFPFIAGEVNDYTDLKDSIIRAPLKKMSTRPIFAKRSQKRRSR